MDAAGDGVVAMRHDVDHNLDHAVLFAEWEAERGYQATYFVLHTAWYYEDKPSLYRGLERLVELGHEVGFHSNVTATVCANYPPRERWEKPAHRLSQAVVDHIAATLEYELALLRNAGFDVTGLAAHGDIGCYEMGVTNDLRYTRLKLDQFGLVYDADLLRRDRGINDNHGALHGSFANPEGKIIALLHPCHWDLAGVLV